MSVSSVFLHQLFMSATFNNSPLVKYINTVCHPKETLENPALSRDNGLVIAGRGWVHGRQAARVR
jgi:hypothetical protein